MKKSLHGNATSERSQRRLSQCVFKFRVQRNYLKQFRLLNITNDISIHSGAATAVVLCHRVFMSSRHCHVFVVHFESALPCEESDDIAQPFCDHGLEFWCSLAAQFCHNCPRLSASCSLSPFVGVTPFQLTPNDDFIRGKRPPTGGVSVSVSVPLFAKQSHFLGSRCVVRPRSRLPYYFCPGFPTLAYLPKSIYILCSEVL